MPNPYTKLYDEHGNIGDGVIKISRIDTVSCVKRSSDTFKVFIAVMIAGK